MSLRKKTRRAARNALKPRKGKARVLSKEKQNDPNTPNNLSRKRWKCKGKKSMK